MMKAIFCQFFAVVIFGIFLFAGNAGASAEFFVNPAFNPSGLSKVSADLNHTGQNAYFYVETAYYSSFSQDDKNKFDANIRDLSQEFDQRIYPKERDLFGIEWNPGIDGDSKITILFTNMNSEQGGYFRADDEYLKSQFKTSNQREMVYLNASKISHPHLKSYLAHEFQHLITFYQKTVKHGLEEETWLDEARSEYATTLLGYNNQWQGSYLQKRVQDFLAQPSDSLTEWKGTSADFGAAFTLMHYIVDRFNEGILRSLTQNDKIGIESVDMALKSLSRPETFNDVFTDWTVTNYINNVLGDYGYRYTYLNNILSYGFLHVLPQASYNVFQDSPIEGSFNIKDWSAKWIRFAPGSLSGQSSRTLTIDFSGNWSEANFIVPYIVNKFSGDSEIKYINLADNKGSAAIPDFGRSVSSVVIAPSTQFKRAGFGYSEPEVSFAFKASLGDSAGTGAFADGDILRAKNDVKVYVKKGNFKRWIRSPEIFNNYGHLSWKNIKEVDAPVLSGFRESLLIKKAGDYKVYEIDASGVRHWLNITAAQFEASGRKWEAIYEINDFEFGWYKTGSMISKI